MQRFGAGLLEPSTLPAPIVLAFALDPRNRGDNVFSDFTTLTKWWDCAEVRLLEHVAIQFDRANPRASPDVMASAPGVPANPASGAGLAG